MIPGIRETDWVTDIFGSIVIWMAMNGKRVACGRENDCNPLLLLYSVNGILSPPDTTIGRVAILYPGRDVDLLDHYPLKVIGWVKNKTADKDGYPQANDKANRQHTIPSEPFPKIDIHTNLDAPFAAKRTNIPEEPSMNSSSG